MSGSAATPGVCTAIDRIAAAESINDLRLRMAATITKKRPFVEMRLSRAAAARTPCRKPPTRGPARRLDRAVPRSSKMKEVARCRPRASLIANRYQKECQWQQRLHRQVHLHR